jgi:hypothetical protein
LSNAVEYEINSKTRGVNKALRYENYLSKHIIDEIDDLLKLVYGFTEEEVNFIKNYNYKFRMSKK